MQLILFLGSLCLYHSLSVKVITVPKFVETKAPSTSFATVKNSSSPALTQVTFCYWTSSFGATVGNTLDWANSFFGLYFHIPMKYIVINRVSVKVKFPATFIFTPEKWFFFCFSYDNKIKALNVFLNSEKIHGKIVKTRYVTALSIFLIHIIVIMSIGVSSDQIRKFKNKIGDAK